MTNFKEAAADDLSEPAVGAALRTRWLGRAYHFLPEVGSTNDYLKALLAKGEPPAGTVVATDFQRQGKGRHQRRWIAPPGSSLLLSILIRPGWRAEQAHKLTMLTAVAAAEAIEAATGLSIGLKWPNDLVVAGEQNWRKLGGILLESEVSGGRLQSAIVGTGINVNIPPDALPETATPATSLLVELGHPVARRPLLIDFLLRLEGAYDAATVVGDVSNLPTFAAWQERLVTLGRQVRVTRPGAEHSSLEGVATGVDEWGRLLVRDARGVVHAVAAGDVTLQPVGPEE